jgi:uncharacterized phage protein gp47/JayE
MPLIIPGRKAVVDSARNSLRAELPELDSSTERRSFIGALVKALGSLMADWYLAMKRYADREPFPQTATGQFLLNGWWRDLTKLEPLAAAPAHGYVAAEGTHGTSIPVGTLFEGSGGIVFESLLGATIANTTILAQSLTYDVGTGRCNFIATGSHYMATGMTVTITGATPSAYNGTFLVTVVDDDDFTYVPLSVPGATTATGTVHATATFAAIEVEATVAGQSTNVSGGTTLAVSKDIPGVLTVTTGANGLDGGTDTESEDSYRARVLEALGTDYGMFTEDEITIIAKQVPGVTRVFVRKAMLTPLPGWPYEGQVKIAFLRDGDANPLPSAQEVNEVKARILALAMPAHTAPEDVVVMSPPAHYVNFTFSSITPDTPGMRKAIIASLAQYFRETAAWGNTLVELDYLCAIRASYDFETRQSLKTFVLSSPTGNITAGTTAGYDVDDFPMLGTVNF